MTRLLVVGLDGATLDLIEPWAREGRLPNLAKLLDEGAWGPLQSVPNMNTAPAWTTFMTGKNPGKHGVFWFAEEGERRGTVRFVNASDRRATSLWRLLSAAGRQIVVANVPLTYPAEAVNGVLMAGFDAPSTTSRGFSHPANVVEEVEAACGRYVLHASVTHHARAGRHQRVVDEALSAEETRVRAALHLFHTRPWNVAMYMLKSTDQVAHHSWQYGTGSQPWMQQVYEYADAAVGRFIEAAGPDCNVVVMSDHGMGWRQPAAEYLNDVLAQLGYLRRAGSVGRGATWHAFRLAKRLGATTRGALKSRLPRLYERFGYNIRFGGIDWAGTRAYCDNTRSCVWINLRGRNPEGTVDGADYPGLREELREMLLGLVDADTGRPIVASAWTPEEIYNGPYTSQAPDLQIDWHYDRPVRGLVYEGRLGSARTERAAVGFMKNLTGAHRRDGVLVAWGPQFSAAGRIEGAGLEDLAPTILHLAGLPVPDDMDGRVLLEALAPEYAGLPVARSGAAVQHQEVGPDDAYSDEEAAEVEGRLRSLGYL